MFQGEGWGGEGEGCSFFFVIHDRTVCFYYCRFRVSVAAAAQFLTGSKCPWYDQCFVSAATDPYPLVRMPIHRCLSFVYVVRYCSSVHPRVNAMYGAGDSSESAGPTEIAL